MRVMIYESREAQKTTEQREERKTNIITAVINCEIKFWSFNY
jgi:hypothetical protein